MKTSWADRAAERYLHELDRELRGLPAARRRDIVGEIAEHIRQARAEEGDEATPVILDRLGDPGEIAADARERFGVQPARPAWVETVTLILLPIGGLVLPVVGWVIGVCLLWTSAVWSIRDKVIGTLFVPGGLLVPFILGGGIVSSNESCVGTSDASGRYTEVCTGGGPSGLQHAITIAVLVLLLIAPFISVAYLARRRRLADVHGFTATHGALRPIN
jgi:uncharacterized membrane protein